PRMPIAIEEDTLLFLVSALLVRTSWLQPFEPGQASFPFEAPAGPWRGRPQIARLFRESSELDDLLVAASGVGPLTLVAVRGDKDISVYLAIADEAAGPGAVVGEAIRIVGGRVEGRRGSSLREGDAAPGLTVDVVPSFQSDPVLHLSTVPFRIDADHDLLRHRDIFGLEAARDDLRGHFPRISPEPLAIRQAKQVATAAFSAEGFEAAAVTAMGVVPGAATFQPGKKRLVVSVRFDRPFAFVAVHRPSRLVLVAGWVADPQPAGAE
ncbi:MAG: hypothetical protein JOZ41_14675, partial [Chloroflexi bacterium]|nr:hypothetical protein [Chloroflexota bacterium]